VAQERIKDNTRDEFRTGVLEDALRDLSHSVRALRRAPGFTILASVTLALGIGATTALFSVVDGLLIKPLPYPDADALVAAWRTAPGMNTPQLPFSASQYATYREETRTFEKLGI
jgi:putative ABC transport system permease protein